MLKPWELPNAYLVVDEAVLKILGVLEMRDGDYAVLGDRNSVIILVEFPAVVDATFYRTAEEAERLVEKQPEAAQ